MKTARVTINDQSSGGRIDPMRVDATSKRDTALQIVKDEALVMLDAAKFARRLRKRLGLNQTEFSRRIDVSLETIRNWDQGKCYPTGAAKVFLKMLDKAPEAAIDALRADGKI
ncbi:helix-turn-helix domain-containing protein [Methylomonas paludis]|uniref:Helix-turn-helix domain-containing protein n=1 Tax=Methylomonas paludis TaxID=1173101 RepID=A0A975R9K4_9GAMM|nr:helix-turn-helix domain-containing protein [Methylomonas paludis]QWF70383.1 helix-turn-helix domain-containing protein [Methylomonas paludis]